MHVAHAPHGDGHLTGYSESGNVNFYDGKNDRVASVPHSEVTQGDDGRASVNLENHIPVIANPVVNLSHGWDNHVDQGGYHHPEKSAPRAAHHQETIDASQPAKGSDIQLGNHHESHDATFKRRTHYS